MTGGVADDGGGFWPHGGSGVTGYAGTIDVHIETLINFHLTTSFMQIHMSTRFYPL